MASIADAADISKQDTVLEIGPGLGTLTSELLRRASKVVAVELDPELAAKLPAQFPGTNLEVVNQDILTFDLTKLPKGYIVVANVPYYITSKIVQLLTTSTNPPKMIVLLVQKEVAERLAAGPSEMSILAVSAQVYAEIELGQIVPAAMFTPPPKVDSQVVVFKMLAESKVPEAHQKDFFRVVKAGFSAKRKKLRSSLASSLHISKPDAENALNQAGIDPNNRAEQLSIDDWKKLLATVKESQIL